MRQYITSTISSIILTNYVCAEFPVGQWSNKKEGFESSSISYLSNGHGHFTKSQQVVSFRWSKEDTTIKTTFAAPPSNPTLEFVATSDPKVAKLKFPDSTSTTYHLVDASEPADIVAGSSASALADDPEHVANFVEESKDVASLEQFLAELSKIKPKDEDSDLTDLAIGSDKWPCMIQLTLGLNQAMVEVTFEEWFAEEQSPRLVYISSKAKPKLPQSPTAHLPTTKRTALETWLKSQNLSCEYEYSYANGPSGIEGYYDVLSIEIPSDDTAIKNLLTHIITTTFEASPTDFKIIRYVEK